MESLLADIKQSFRTEEFYVLRLSLSLRWRSVLARHRPLQTPPKHLKFSKTLRVEFLPTTARRRSCSRSSGTAVASGAIPRGSPHPRPSSTGNLILFHASLPKTHRVKYCWAQLAKELPVRLFRAHFTSHCATAKNIH
jgi:hypothetical protein